MPDTNYEVAPWWKEGVFYEIYPRSYQDTDGDGVGDLRGIIDRLDYLEWLGIDGIWLNPTMPSPNDDWGYDVADYKGVHPELGTLEDLDELIGEARNRGIGILLDLVPNHTSSEHEWFRDSRSSRNSAHRDWYVWAEPRPDGSPPNNWISVFGGGPAWELDESTRQYYLHNFLVTQPDLNWWNDDVRDAIDDVFRFWFAKGVAGFRIDVAHAIIKDKELRDNLPATKEDPPLIQQLGQRHTYSMDQPEVHDVIRRWNELAQEYDDPQRILVGETFLLDLNRMAQYYGKGDELHLAFNFVFIFSAFEARPLRECIELTEELLPELAQPVWTGSNHDVLRMASRWCEGDERKIRLALLMILTLRGTPFLYAGDEIGMTNVEVAFEDVMDPVGKRSWTDNRGRDPGRTPMQWSPDEGAGFAAANVKPWLPLGDYKRVNVADQKDDPSSVLSLARSIIATRRASVDLRRGGYRSLPSPGHAWVYRRGKSTVVALNFSAQECQLDIPLGEVICATDPSRVGEKVSGSIGLGPWEGVVVEG